MKITIGTRGSALALWQARHVRHLISANRPEYRVELLTIKTKGDKILDAPLARIGGKGLFTKEIEDALLDGKVDVAVHSMKDLPTELPGGLKVGAILQREDPRDVFVSRDGRGLHQLRAGDLVGTSSLRRQAFLTSRYPEIKVVSIRGNVDTRLRKIETEGLAGVVLASAGITRMGFTDRVTSYLELDVMIPAIGQGAMGIEIREDDPTTEAVVSGLTHRETELCVNAERAFLRRMGGGCQVPMAAHAVAVDGRLTISAAVVHPHGQPVIRESITGDLKNPEIGADLADMLIQRGGDEIARSVLGQDWRPGPREDTAEGPLKRQDRDSSGR
jgi:hydroxymethylbilane synthase